MFGTFVLHATSSYLCFPCIYHIHFWDIHFSRDIYLSYLLIFFLPILLSIIFLSSFLVFLVGTCLYFAIADFTKKCTFFSLFPFKKKMWVCVSSNNFGTAIKNSAFQPALDQCNLTHFFILSYHRSFSNFIVFIYYPNIANLTLVIHN